MCLGFLPLPSFLRWRSFPWRSTDFLSFPAKLCCGTLLRHAPLLVLWLHIFLGARGAFSFIFLVLGLRIFLVLEAPFLSTSLCCTFSFVLEAVFSMFLVLGLHISLCLRHIFSNFLVLGLRILLVLEAHTFPTSCPMCLGCTFSFVLEALFQLPCAWAAHFPCALAAHLPRGAYFPCFLCLGCTCFSCARCTPTSFS
jgi:hypothetical protein